MDHYRQSLRIGAAAIVCALLLKLWSIGFFQPAADFLTQPNIAALLIYLETGRHVRFSQSSGDQPVFSMESHTPDFARRPVELTPVPTFTREEGAAVPLRYNCPLRPDAAELITRPLSWDLASGEPTVLILHTHATESYTKAPGETYRESAAYRTTDEDYNMISVGAYLTQLLEAGGIGVIHDKTLHDYPSYSGSYNHARASTAEHLEKYPSIRLVLDLHRDASGDNDDQLRTEAVADGQPCAQLMLVMGTGSGGLHHPDWEENLALALKIHVQCEKLAPGIMRYVNLRSQRFNQDLSPGALLVEVGAAGNSRAEALTAVQVLAEGILSLAGGSGVS